MRRGLRRVGPTGMGALGIAMLVAVLWSGMASLTFHRDATGPAYAVNPPAWLACERVWSFGTDEICRISPPELRRLPAGLKVYGPMKLSVPKPVAYAPDGPANVHRVFHGDSPVTGRGVVVAVIDSGVDYTHPALRSAVLELWTIRMVSGSGGYLRWRVGVNGTLDDLAAFDESVKSSMGEYAFNDELGHGTHVAGVIAGREVDGWRGMAPGAMLVSIKMFGRSGTASLEDALNALQLVYDHAERLGIDVLNLSWGASVLSDGNDPISVAASAIARDRGVLVLAAAGNDGNAMFSVNIPAAGRRVIAVGAVDPFTDRMADFSSFGPTADMRMKPDVAAAGVSIVGPRSSKSSLPAYQGDSRFTRLSGTSMATAVASGIAALYVEVMNEAGYSRWDRERLLLDVTRARRYNPWFKDFISGIGILMAP